MRRATVDLPQPDSPTRESVSPRLIENDTPSTAFSSWRGAPSITRLSHGRETSKSLARLRASSSTSAMNRSLAPVAAGAGRLAVGVVQPAGRVRAVRRQQRRAIHAALVEHARATRVEGAPRRDRGEARHRALDLRQALDLLAH